MQHSEGRAMAEELNMLFFEAHRAGLRWLRLVFSVFALHSETCLNTSPQASSCKPDLVDAVFNGIAEGLVNGVHSAI